MRRIVLICLTLLFAACVALWWTYFHSKRFETALWLRWHHSELAQIRDELAAHPALCKVWIGEAPDVLCDKHLTAADRDAFRKVAGLLHHVDGIEVYSETDYRGKLARVSVEIFAQALLAPPEDADWYRDKDDIYLQLQMKNKGCSSAGPPQWYACDGKVIFI
ncbi:MAG TPA: hypothetical protein VMF58_13010 [Rhizomicrobium sp.]|nr:hypothetical protein [Rhizomicrobium sp.]